MKKLSRADLLALGQDSVDGVIVFERTEKGTGQGSRIACIYGALYTIKRWQDAEGKILGDTPSTQKEAVAYYEKPAQSQ